MATNLTASTSGDFDADVTQVNTGADTAYTIAVQQPITIGNETLDASNAPALEVDGPAALTVTSGDVVTVDTGTLTLDTPVSGDTYVYNVSGGSTVTLDGGALVNGSSSDAGSNQILSGTVLGQSTTDSVDNFGQIAVSTATGDDAVFLNAGTVTNEATGTIQGGTAGAVFNEGSTVTNLGTITGNATGYGLYFFGPGTVTNGAPATGNAAANTTATIQSGLNAIDIEGDTTATNSVVTNSAVILATGTGGAGVNIAQGTVDNGLDGATGASIEGGEYGVLMFGTALVADTVTNLGTIEATDTDSQVSSGSTIVGVGLADGGSVFNGFTFSQGNNPQALISGADVGVLVQGASGTVYNSGTISGMVAVNFQSAGGQVQDSGAITSTAGASGTAIQFGGGDSLLRLASTFDITGMVEGGTGSGATTTLDVIAGTSGTFSGIGNGSGTVANGTAANGFGFDDVTVLELEAGATWTFSGTNAVDTLQLGGEADVAAGGTLEITDAATGTATATAQTAGTSTISLGSGANLVIDAAAGFGTGQGTSNYTGDVIAQFLTGDGIDLRDVAFTGETHSFGNDILQVTSGSATADLLFTTGQFSAASSFNFASDGMSGTLVTVACYCPGTRIATPHGERPVESLAIGDLVMTAEGRAEAIRWIGRRSYAGRFLAANPRVQPIRFRAGSLGEGLPRRDLLVSPEHAMLLDGLLIPARCLVNGTGIVQERGLAGVDYLHIELADHDAILAEGAASETFIDDDSRSMFENAADYAALYPDAPAAGAFCAPRVEDGYELEDIRQRLGEMGRWFAEAA